MSRLVRFALAFAVLAASACGGGDGGGGSGSCGAPQLRCGDTCVDVASEPNHCGACGHACGAGAACVAGECRDPVCSGALGLPGPAWLEFGTWTRDALLADFDGDGDLDLFASDGATTAILHFRNDGGDLVPAGTLPALGSGRLAAGDLDGDGKTDLVVGDDVSTILLGADPTNAIDQENVGTVLDVEVADFDGDGDLDPAFLSLWNGGVVVHRLDNDGLPPPFQSTVAIDGLPIDRNAMAAGDFTGDGRLDLVVTAAEARTLYLFRGTASGTFDALDVRTLPRVAADVALADVDGDRALDVVSTNGMALRGDGAGGFLQDVDVVDPAPTCERLQVIDLDGDGLPEVLCGGAGGDLWLGWNQQGRIVDGGVVPVASGWPIPLAADLGRGEFELLVATETHAVLLPRSDVPDRPFVVRDAMGRLAGTAPAVVQGDLDGDGDRDALFVPGGGTELGLFLGGADGLEAAGAVDAPVPAAVTFAAAGDVDGDGRLEVVTYAESLGCLVVADVQGGALVERSRLPTAGTVVGLATADVDGDGTSDRIALKANPDVLTVHWGAGGATDGPAPVWPGALAAADVDGDGRAEILVGGHAEAILVRGDRTTGLAGVGFLSTRTTALGAGDLDGDGAVEVVLLSPDRDRVVVLGWTGGGLEERASAPLAHADPASLVVADLDGDGQRDVIVASAATAGLHLLRGRGDGTLEAGAVWTAFGGDGQGAPPPAVALLAIEGDHRPDVFVAGWHEQWLLRSVCLP